MRTVRTAAAFVVLVASASYAIFIVGPFVRLAVLDEASFPAPVTANRGSLLFGTDAGTVYVSNGTSWGLVASGTAPSIYGQDYNVYRCVLAPFSGSNLVNQGAISVVNNSVAPATQALTDSTFLTQAPRVSWSPGAATPNSRVGGRVGIARSGLTSAYGPTNMNMGLFTWARWFSIPSGPTSTFFAGLRFTLDGGAEPEDGGLQGCAPSNGFFTIYMGCDPTEDNMSICSNDGTGTATCTNLGANFPCDTGTQYSDLTFTIPTGGGSVAYYVKNLLNGSTASGTLTTDLPDTLLPLLWDFRGCNGSDGGIQTIGFSSLCFGQD